MTSRWDDAEPRGTSPTAPVGEVNVKLVRPLRDMPSHTVPDMGRGHGGKPARTGDHSDLGAAAAVPTLEFSGAQQGHGVLSTRDERDITRKKRHVATRPLQ